MTTWWTTTDWFFFFWNFLSSHLLGCNTASHRRRQVSLWRWRWWRAIGIWKDCAVQHSTIQLVLRVLARGLQGCCWYEHMSNLRLCWVIHTGAIERRISSQRRILYGVNPVGLYSSSIAQAESRIKPRGETKNITEPRSLDTKGIRISLSDKSLAFQLYCRMYQLFKVNRRSFVHTALLLVSVNAMTGRVGPSARLALLAPFAIHLRRSTIFKYSAMTHQP